jgi:membrane fusion protein (multidrug efflux system)
MKRISCLTLCVLLMLTLGFSLFARDGGEEAKKAKCPRKVAVMAETVKPELFREYQYFSALALPDVIEMKSPVAGVVSEVKVSEGSLVEAEQELVILNSGMTEEIKKLEAAVAKKKKILKDRQNWKVKSAKAVQAAEKDLADAVALLEKKSAQAFQVVKASGPGIVFSLKANAGDEIAADAALLEIVDPHFMSVTIPLAAADGTFFQAGEKISGKSPGVDGDIAAEVIAIDEARLVLRVDNPKQQIEKGSVFTIRKLKMEHENALAVPSAALTKDSLGNYVYVIEKKKAKKTYVTPGAREAGKTMIVNGLSSGQQVAVSGLECLKDGKKVKAAAPEELEKPKTEAEVAPVTEAVRPRSLFGNKAKVGAHGTYYLMLAKNFKETYVELTGFGGELSYRFSNKMDVWVSGGMASKKATFTRSDEIMQFKMIPLVSAVRYYIYEEGKLSAYVGAGPSVFLVKDSSPTGDIKTTVIGANVMAGTYYQFSRNLYGQFQTKFYLAKKDLYPDSSYDDPLNLNCLVLSLGLAISL